MSLLYQALIAVKSIADFKPREYNAALTEQQRDSEGIVTIHSQWGTQCMCV